MDLFSFNDLIEARFEELIINKIKESNPDFNENDLTNKLLYTTIITKNDIITFFDLKSNDDYDAFIIDNIALSPCLYEDPNNPDHFTKFRYKKAYYQNLPKVNDEDEDKNEDIELEQKSSMPTSLIKMNVPILPQSTEIDNRLHFYNVDIQTCGFCKHYMHHLLKCHYRGIKTKDTNCGCAFFKQKYEKKTNNTKQ